MINKSQRVREIIRENYNVRDTFMSADILEEMPKGTHQKHVAASLSGLERNGFIAPAPSLMNGKLRPIVWRLVKALPKNGGTKPKQQPQKLAAQKGPPDLSSIPSDRLLLELRRRLKDVE